MRFNLVLMKKLRQEHGYTQAQLANILGYTSEACYRGKEKGAYNFNVNDLYLLSKLYSIQIEDMLIED